MLLRELYDRGPRLYPDKHGIIDGAQHFSYREAGERHNLLADALLGLGLRRHDRLGLLLKNGTELIDAHAAGAKLGVTVGGVNYRLSLDGIRQTLLGLRCRALILDHEYAERIDSIRSELPFVESFVIVGGSWRGVSAYESLLEAAQAVDPWTPTDPDDRAAVVFTTGAVASLLRTDFHPG